MSEIQFDGEEERRVLYSRVESSSRTPKMVQAVADKWLGGDAKRATTILLGLALVMVILAILWPVVFGGDDGNELPLSEQALSLEEEARLLK